jgi:hypothetical protein
MGKSLDVLIAMLCGLAACYVLALIGALDWYDLGRDAQRLAAWIVSALD